MNRKQRKRKKKGTDLSRLHPAQAEGLTQGPRALEEANERFPAMDVSQEKTYGHALRPQERVPGTRQPRPSFRAVEDNDAVWVDPVNGTVRRDAKRVYPAEVVQLLKEGRQCLNCDEPQPDPFPVSCDLCGYGMREHQRKDFAEQFEGEHWLGPEESLQDLVDMRELEYLKREFDMNVLGRPGAS